MNAEISRDQKRRIACVEAMEDIEEWLRTGDARLPSMLARAREMFFDDSTEMFETKELDGDGKLVKLTMTERKKVSEKGKLVILQAFARITAQKEQYLAAKGLGKGGPRKIEHHQHLTLVFNKTEDEIKAMEPAARELYLKMSVDALTAEATQGP